MCSPRINHTSEPYALLSQLQFKLRNSKMRRDKNATAATRHSSMAMRTLRRSSRVAALFAHWLGQILAISTIVFSVPHTSPGGSAQRPLCGLLPQVEVTATATAKAMRLDQHVCDRAPPHGAAMAEACRSANAIHRSRARHHGLRSTARCRSRSARSGQNHPIKQIATGIEPHTTAHGVKIDPISIAVVAIAESSGQIVGAGRSRFDRAAHRASA